MTTSSRAAHDAVPAAGANRTYPQPLAGSWFLRRRGYVLYVIREFTAVPIAIWMIWFLVEIGRLRDGRAGYHAHLSGAFIAFSVVCLVFALWHSLTFLSFAGLIMRIPLGDRLVGSRVIAGGAFFGLAVASAVIIALLVWAGR
jgi:fumarate reductase subunit C